MSRESAVSTEEGGETTFIPEFSKSEARYMEKGTTGFDETHDRCGDCVHYIRPGACHLVRGEISPTNYCAEFYADYQVSAHNHGHGEGIEVNYEEYGGAFDFSIDDTMQFSVDIRERLQQAIRDVRRKARR